MKGLNSKIRRLGLTSALVSETIQWEFNYQESIRRQLQKILKFHMLIKPKAFMLFNP